MLKKGLTELVKIGYLKKFNINRKGIVTVEKVQLPSIKAKLAKEDESLLWEEEPEDESSKDKPMIIGPEGKPIPIKDY